MLSGGLACLLLVVVAECRAASAPSQYEEVVIDGPRGTKGFISIKGGNIRLFRRVIKPGTNVTMNTGEVNINFCSIRELNSTFGQVTDAMNRTRVMSTMADQIFSCWTHTNVQLPYSTNVTADCMDCSTDINQFSKTTKFTIKACIVKDNGTITQMDEVSNVTAGQLKLTVEMSNGWQFCDNTCKGGEGKYLDLDVCLKLPPGAGRMVKVQPDKQPFRPKIFNLGSGASVQFSTKIELDGVWTNLTSGYPNLTQKAADTNVITLRFPQFINTLVYDPTIDVGDTFYLPGAAPLLKCSCLILVVALLTSILQTIV